MYTMKITAISHAWLSKHHFSPTFNQFWQPNVYICKFKNKDLEQTTEINLAITGLLVKHQQII